MTFRGLALNPSGARYNQLWNGNHYIVQDIWALYGCTSSTCFQPVTGASGTQGCSTGMPAPSLGGGSCVSKSSSFMRGTHSKSHQSRSNSRRSKSHHSVSHRSKSRRSVSHRSKSHRSRSHKYHSKRPPFTFSLSHRSHSKSHRSHSRTKAVSKSCINPPPSVSNAVVSSGCNSGRTSNGGTCTYTCFIGYGGTAPTALCANTVWTTAGICTRLTCSGTPTALFSNSLAGDCVSGQVEGTTCVPTCAFGYQGSLLATCTTSGQWQATSGSCVPGCGAPPVLKNAAVNSTCVGSINQLCSYTCQASTSGIVSAKCETTGSWVVTGLCGSSNKKANIFSTANIGTAVGAIAGIVAVGLLVLFIVKKRKNDGNRMQEMSYYPTLTAATTLPPPSSSSLNPVKTPPPIPTSRPLPPNWVEFSDEEGTPYYFNSITQVTQWTRPL